MSNSQRHRIRELTAREAGLLDTIRDLRKENELLRQGVDAMKEGVAIRIADLESTIMRLTPDGR